MAGMACRRRASGYAALTRPTGLGDLIDEQVPNAWRWRGRRVRSVDDTGRDGVSPQGVGLRCANPTSYVGAVVNLRQYSFEAFVFAIEHPHAIWRSAGFGLGVLERTFGTTSYPFRPREPVTTCCIRIPACAFPQLRTRPIYRIGFGLAYPGRVRARSPTLQAVIVTKMCVLPASVF
jgi:hypothetical protein